MKNKIMAKFIEAGSEYFLYFFAYSVIGWCYEVFLETVVYSGDFQIEAYYLDHTALYMDLVCCCLFLLYTDL